MDLELTKLELTKILQTEFSCLIELNYEFLGVDTKSSRALGTFLEGRYSNVSANRIVKVTYIPKGDGPREVTITRIGQIEKDELEDFDYTSTCTMKVHSLAVSEISDEFYARIETYAKETAKKLKGDFLMPLKGLAWHSDQMDWSGYK